MTFCCSLSAGYKGQISVDGGWSENPSGCDILGVAVSVYHKFKFFFPADEDNYV